MYEDHHVRKYDNGLMLLTVNLKHKGVECDVRIVTDFKPEKVSYRLRVDYVDPDLDAWDWEFVNITENVRFEDYYSHFTNLEKDQYTILLIPHKMMKYKRSITVDK